MRSVQIISFRTWPCCKPGMMTIKQRVIILSGTSLHRFHFFLPPTSKVFSIVPTRSFVRFFRATTCALENRTKVTVERNIPYANDHPRNVLDLYKPAEDSQMVATSPSPVLLFVHGGMWVRGSKDQNSLSTYDVLSSLASRAYHQMFSSEKEEENNQDGKTRNMLDASFSNVGLTVATNGGNAYIMNYRLAASEENVELAHPHQVMDVARAIVFMLERQIIQSKRTIGHEGDAANIYIGGHSSGAHLAALALSDPQYVHKLMDERGMDRKFLSKMIAGFIGISGVYNLRRLAMSPLAELTLGPAFLKKKEGDDDLDVTLEASPVHVIIRQHKKERGSKPPPLADIPVLLLNAESDLHLHQDSGELLVALQHCACGMDALSRHSIDSSSEENNSQGGPVIVRDRNHLSIMRDFGHGLFDTDSVCLKEETVAGKRPGNDESNNILSSWNITTAVNKSIDVLSSATSSLSSYMYESNGIVPDETAQKVLEFMKLDPKARKQKG